MRRAIAPIDAGCRRATRRRPPRRTEAADRARRGQRHRGPHARPRSTSRDPDRTDVVWLDRRGRRPATDKRGRCGWRRCRWRAAARAGCSTQSTVVLTSATLTVGGTFDAMAGAGAWPASDDEQPGWRGSTSARRSHHAKAGILYVAAHLPAARPRRHRLRRATRRDRRAGQRRGRPHARAVLVDARRQGGRRGDARAPRHPGAVPGRRRHRRRWSRQFAADDETSLFGTLSLWQGVDVPGPSLSLVMIDRIPFPRPDDPLRHRPPARGRGARRQRLHGGRGQPRRAAARPGRGPAAAPRPTTAASSRCSTRGWRRRATAASCAPRCRRSGRRPTPARVASAWRGCDSLRACSRRYERSASRSLSWQRISVRAAPAAERNERRRPVSRRHLARRRGRRMRGRFSSTSCATTVHGHAGVGVRRSVQGGGHACRRRPDRVARRRTASRSRDVTGTDGGEIDDLAASAVSDIEEFWDDAYGETFDGEFTPVKELVSWDSDGLRRRVLRRRHLRPGQRRVLLRRQHHRLGSRRAAAVTAQGQRRHGRHDGAGPRVRPLGPAPGRPDHDRAPRRWSPSSRPTAWPASTCAGSPRATRRGSRSAPATGSTTCSPR